MLQKLQLEAENLAGEGKYPEIPAQACDTQDAVLSQYS